MEPASCDLFRCAGRRTDEEGAGQTTHAGSTRMRRHGPLTTLPASFESTFRPYLDTAIARGGSSARLTWLNDAWT